MPAYFQFAKVNTTESWKKKIIIFAKINLFLKYDVISKYGRSKLNSKFALKKMAKLNDFFCLFQHFANCAVFVYFLCL